jgi:biopolymer transport protein ExbD
VARRARPGAAARCIDRHDGRGHGHRHGRQRGLKERSMHGGSMAGGVKRARIEIIPLIDIIFFLLATFVMVSLSMTKNQGMQVALPAAASSESLSDAQQKDQLVTLSVNAAGEVFYNKEKTTLAQLPFRLQSLKSSTKDPRVVINGDSQADFKTVVALLDEVRKIGITKVGIATNKR